MTTIGCQSDSDVGDEMHLVDPRAYLLDNEKKAGAINNPKLDNTQLKALEREKKILQTRVRIHIQR